MNPACKIDLAGRECQDWMTKVCAHCSSLLPDAEEAVLWDSWWPDELPSPYKSLVNYMSAFDCHKLRREVARLVEEPLSSTGDSAQYCTPTRIYRYAIVAMVVCAVLALMMCIVWIVMVTFRHRPVPHHALRPPNVCPADVEAAQSKKSSSESATLRKPVKLAFAGQSGSRTHLGLHRKNSSIEAGCLCNQDNISLYPEPGTAQSSGSREQLSSRYN
ncbi:uncharacterized protein LOC111068455 [Drosophila obscura]|uniref:uncharacterized protein LOC111068455 n=1 Tax=Drosophila obscura TaxID=7282 RepID=UPI000BA0EE16|nr:uncharacterized protein LOC111068455 [Drosophila obscura]